MPHSHLICTDEKLLELVERAEEEGKVALDTEFLWERTYYPKLSLIPIAFENGDSFMLDVLAIPDLSSLGRVVANPDIQKLLHDAEQDLICLRRATGAYPINVFDTQCAAGFAFLSASVSLQSLLKETGVAELEKTETRTDWTKRPLTEKQLLYAMEDVKHLFEAQRILLERSRAKGHEAWVLEEMKRYDDPERYSERDAAEQFRRVKGMGRVKGRGIVVLRALTAWREEEARTRDRPRGHIVPDPLLIDFSINMPRSAQDFSTLDSKHNRPLKRYGKMLLEVQEDVLQGDTLEYPPFPPAPSNRNALKLRTDKALEIIRKMCTERGLDPVLVAPRAKVTELLGRGRRERNLPHSLLRGWRREFLADTLVQILAL